MYRLHRSFIFVCILQAVAFGQDDSLFRHDPYQAGIDTAELMEQISPSENSPMSDIRQQSPGGDTAVQIAIRSRDEVFLQTPEGYTDGHYQGSLLHSYQRISYRQKGRFQAGLLFEKDPGEISLADFCAFHVTWENLGICKRILVGDYLLETGQGLCLWRSTDYSKGKDVIAPLRRQARLLVPYLSSGEQNYLNGGAATFAVGPASTTLYFSRRIFSANTGNDGRVKSIESSGLYRTATELKERDNTAETSFGLLFRADPSPGTEVGVTWCRSLFSKDLALRSPAISGNNFTALSVDGMISRERFSVFGEGMVSNGKGGGIASVVFYPVSPLGWIVSFRRYRHDWFSLHGLGFGEGSAVSDEEGWYFGAILHPVRTARFSMYLDRFRFVSSAADHPFPTGGREWEISLDLIPEAKIRCEIEFNQKSTGDSRLNSTVRSRYTAGVKKALSDAVSVGSRLEYLSIATDPDREPQTGSLFYAELTLNPAKRINIDCRMMMFRTDSFDARVAEYEKNPDGEVSVQTLYGDGVKWYILLTGRISGAVTFQAKYSDLIRDDVVRIGNGDDRLPSNRDNRIVVQCDIRI